MHRFASRPKTDLETPHKSLETTSGTQTEQHVLADE
jgi:hypothetical protein